MPSSLLIPAMQGSPAQLAYPASYRPDQPLIGPWSPNACLHEIKGHNNGTAVSSQTYPSANRAYGYQFQLSVPYPVLKVWWGNGATTGTDNADVAVFSEDGATLIVSGGSTLITGTSTKLQEVDCTDTLLLPGTYWCVYNQSGVVATPLGFSFGATIHGRTMGMAQMSGAAVPLAAPFTPAAHSGTFFPLFGIASRTQVA